MGLEAATYIDDLVTSNPAAGDTKSQGDDHLRLLKAVLKATFPGADLPFYISTDRTDVASATTCDLGAVASQYVNITGTTTITGFGTCNAGTWSFFRFNAALTLTHDGTALILPSAANIVTVAGDHAVAISRGSGNWTVILYVRATGAALINAAATTSLAGIVELATNAETLTGTDTARVAPVSSMVQHKGMAKAWGLVDSDGTLLAGYNCSSASGGSGTYSITFTTALGSANYAAVLNLADASNSGWGEVKSMSTTGFSVVTRNTSGNNQARKFAFVVFGAF